MGHGERLRHLFGIAHRPLEHLFDREPRLLLGQRRLAVGHELVDVEHGPSSLAASLVVNTFTAQSRLPPTSHKDFS